MNKNLETEYQNMIRAEVPDIWDKIEAKIDAQEAQKKVVTFKKKTTRWQYYVIPAAAALLCVAIAIPVILRGGSANSSGTAAMPASDTATGSACSTTDDMYMETACEAEPGAYYEDATEAERDKKNSVNNYSFNMQGDNSAQFATSTISGEQGKDEAAAAGEDEEADDNEDHSIEAQPAQLVLIVSADKSVKRAEIEELAESMDFDIAEDEEEENSYIFTSRRPYETKEVIGITEYLMEFKGITGVRIESGDVR